MRLKSDRFFSKDYGPDIYTQPGIDWVEETTMLDVLRRHFPGLTPALRGVKSAFHPWNKVGGSAVVVSLPLEHSTPSP